MAQEQLQLIITADNKEALKAIEDLAKSTEGLKYKFQQSKGATDQATQALMNLSRVAQDAPYGFMGIANNINPLLESFQRLGEKTKESGGAFKALREALIGPAGVGLAVGVLSSVIVKYGDAIAEALFNTTEFEKAQKSLRDAMGDSVKSVADDVAKNEALLSIVNNLNESTKNRQAALEQLKSTYKGNIELQKLDINDGEKLKQVVDNISEALLRKAKIEAYAKLIAEEQAKIARDQIATVEDQVDKLNIWQKSIAFVSGAFSGFSNVANIGLNLVDAGLKKTNKEIQTSTTIVKGLTEGLKDLTKQSVEAGDAMTLSTTAPKKPRTVKEKLSKIKFNEPSLYDADIEEMIRKQDKELGIGGRPNILGDTFLTDTDKNKPASKLGFATGKKEQDKWFEDSKKNFEELNKQALEFANTIANTITNSIMGMWDALQQGTPVLQALGDMFMDLAKQIAAAAIKAAVFATILNIVFPGSGGAASAGGFGGIFKSILGLPVTKNADGGITNGPSLGLIGEGNEREAIMPLSKLGTMMQNTFNAGAMSGNGMGGGGNFVLRGNDLVLALQRSNYSLNLRRGA